MELLSDGDYEIFNALSMPVFVGEGARQRWFCTWADGVGRAAGPSLVYPWRRRARLRAGVEMDADGSTVIVTQLKWRLTDVIRHRRWSVIVVANPSTSERLLFSASGWLNSVTGRRADGSVVVKFPATSRQVQIDAGATESEQLLMLVAIGSGVAHRARRFGLAARSI